ncbi:hypothetical protein MGYG_02414 [Nannizzia gypsea CBS 118893]|uniref:DUF6590 domain-containing protein n=1 Tax=Arthroderma gypseum (strain ATCC MYA-4604 / CBS 118893) TaxID=535722 RepID=E4URI0_ARTGP|nr:hypothetical protein MGYG_02414 [Nannizzia gypsea CBS 118893]EFQ99402.1 hypothetical protein MGYG_02414 [Nannizzia gypsea CBS 118893]
MLRPLAEYPGGPDPYYSRPYGRSEPISEDGLVQSPSNYDEGILDNSSAIRHSIDSGYHGGSSGFPAYPDSNQRQPSTIWDPARQSSHSYPSPTPSQYDPVNGAPAPSHLSYQSDGYSPYGLQETFTDYKVQTTPFYSIGRVISVYWAEPAGDTSAPHGRGSPYFYLTGHGQEVHANIRRMVVVKNEQGCSWCLAIYTYGERGLMKPGIDLKTHSVIHVRGTQPEYYGSGRVPGISPIMINPYTPRDQLHPKSCLNFGKVFTVDHNIKVKPIGQVSEECMRVFRRAWRQCVENEEYGNYEPLNGYPTDSYR